MSVWRYDLILGIGQTYPVTSPLPQARPPREAPIVLEEAEIRWGKPSQFDYGTRKGPHLKYSVNFKRDPGDEDEEEPEIPEIVLTEVENTRKTTPVKVQPENNPDPEIWVEFARIDEIAFEGNMSAIPVGYTGPVRFKYVLKHPAVTT